MAASFGNGGKIQQTVILRSGFVCCLPYKFGRGTRTHKTRHYKLLPAVRRAMRFGGWVENLKTGEKILPVPVKIETGRD